MLFKSSSVIAEDVSAWTECTQISILIYLKIQCKFYNSILMQVLLDK